MTIYLELLMIPKFSLWIIFPYQIFSLLEKGMNCKKKKKKCQCLIGALFSGTRPIHFLYPLLLGHNLVAQFSVLDQIDLHCSPKGYEQSVRFAMAKATKKSLFTVENMPMRRSAT